MATTATTTLTRTAATVATTIATTNTTTAEQEEGKNQFVAKLAMNSKTSIEQPKKMF